MRGPTSRYFAGSRLCQRSGGSITWSSTETSQSRSYCVMVGILPTAVLPRVALVRSRTAFYSSDMTQESQVSTPFAGIRVVELAQWVFVPAAGALLADWGADVIHIEPLDGDPYRGLVSLGIHAAGKDGVNMAMEATNRNKRSMAIDIRTDRGMELLLELVDGADVFLTNFRPNALERRGLDPDSLRARNPRLVYARGNGFGSNGPQRDRAGYDASAFWARGGLAHILTP